MNIHSQIRKLARSSYWQEIYKSSKEINGISLFENNYNFSGLQYLFLYWLRIYNMLYTELSEKEWTILDEQVIETDWRCDCFLYWRSKEIEKKIKQYKIDSAKGNKKKSGIPIWDGKPKGKGKTE